MPIEPDESKAWRARFLLFAAQMRAIARPHDIFPQSPIIEPPRTMRNRPRSILVGLGVSTEPANNDNKRRETMKGTYADTSNLEVTFLSHNRKAQCQPNPKYPDGIALDLSDGAENWCKTNLPYPAECCGVLIVRCTRCGSGHAITTAGRPDDPKSVKLPCQGIHACPDSVDPAGVLREDGT